VITLDRLVNVLAGSGARLVCCPRSRDVLLRSLIVHDPTDTRTATGDVFLAVGVDTPDRAVHLAALARATVVILRASTPLERGVQETAEESGLAVVLAEPAATWSHLIGLAYGLVLEGRETEAGRGPTDLFALADTLAAAVGGPVVIEDQLSRVLAYSSLDDAVDAVRSQTILGRRVTDRAHAARRTRGRDPGLRAPGWSHGLRHGAHREALPVSGLIPPGTNDSFVASMRTNESFVPAGITGGSRGVSGGGRRAPARWAVCRW